MEWRGALSAPREAVQSVDYTVRVLTFIVISGA